MLKRIIAATLAAAALGSAAQAEPISEKGVENRLIVALRSANTPQQADGFFARHGLKVLADIPQANLYLVESRPGLAPMAMEKLSADENVRQVAPDQWIQWLRAGSVASLPMPTVEEALRGLPKAAELAAKNVVPSNDPEIAWGVRRSNAAAAWATGNEGQGVKVCIVDTGVDPNVPDLQGQVVTGKNFIDQNAPWVDDHFHGTHVGGIVAAKRDGKGVVGVAPKAKLYAAKVLSKDGGGNIFSILQGVMWCGEQKTEVINMSLGANQSIPFLEEIINQVVQQGHTVIAAAGNGDGNGGPAPVGYPAAYASVIAISALDDTDNITKWSSRGPQVAFIAPGHKIPSTVPLSHDASGVKAYSGTSMACPHAAGLAALAVVKGARGKDAIKAKLLSAAEKLPNLPQTEQGSGVINAGKL